MTRLPLPVPFRLDPPGPHVAPTAVGSPGLVIDLATGLSQLRLILVGDIELRLPLTNEAYQRLKDMFRLAPDAPGYDEEN